MNGDTSIPFIYREALPFSFGLAVVREQGQYGYIDTSGKTVIPMIYDHAERFEGKYIQVRKNGIIYILDTQGNTLYQTKGSYATMDEPYITICSTQGDLEHCQVLLIPENKIFDRVEIREILSDSRFLMLVDGKRLEVWDHKANITHKLPYFPDDLDILENQGFVIAPQKNKIDANNDPKSLFLYTPDGILRKEIVAENGYTLKSFKPLQNASNPLFIIQAVADYKHEERPDFNNKVFACDINGTLTPYTGPLPEYNMVLPKEENLRFKIILTDSGKFAIHYASGQILILPDSGNYYQLGNLIGVYRHTPKKGITRGLFDDSLRTILPMVAQDISYSNRFKELLIAKSDDSLWYINPTGEIIWRKKQKDKIEEHSIYKPLINSADVKYNNEINQDSLEKKVLHRLPDTIRNNARMVYVDLMDTTGNSFPIYFCNNTSNGQAIQQYTLIQVKDTLGNWKTIDGPGSWFSTGTHIPPTYTLLPPSKMGLAHIFRYKGVFSTEMRLGFRWYTQGEENGRKFIWVYSNSFPVGINPDQLY